MENGLLLDQARGRPAPGRQTRQRADGQKNVGSREGLLVGHGRKLGGPLRAEGFARRVPLGDPTALLVFGRHVPIMRHLPDESPDDLRHRAEVVAARE